MTTDRKTLERRDSLLIGRGGAAGAKVVVLSGPDEGTEVPLVTTVEIGSDEGCDLVLHDDTTSRRHAVVALVAGALHVRDRGSTNGTFLGSSRAVEAEVPLGAVLRIGGTLLAIQPRWHVRELPPSPARRFGQVLGESVAMRELFAVLERVAPTMEGQRQRRRRRQHRPRRRQRRREGCRRRLPAGSDQERGHRQGRHRRRHRRRR
jgi:hypothetical protein